MNLELMEKYIKLIIKKGINIQRNQKLLIICPIECAWFAHRLTKVAYQAGSGEVFVRWIDEEGERIRYMYASDDVFGSYPEWNQIMMNGLCKEKAAFIFISASDPNIFQGVLHERIQRDNKAAQSALQYYQNNLVINRSQWCVLSIPSESWAKKVFPGLDIQDAIEKLWEAIFHVSYIDRNDPIRNWNEHIQKLFDYQKMLNANHFKTLLYENGMGTKLSVELVPGHIWIGGSEKTLGEGVEFIANIPTEEIFTTPRRNGVNGVVYATKPLVYMGNVIEDFMMEFVEGEIVKVTAKKNQDILEKLVLNVPGCNFLGEVALVSFDSPISELDILFYNGLYDENASCHLALGKAYPLTVRGAKNKSEKELVGMGINCSEEHIDFMIGSPDMRVIGVTYTGNQIPILVNGKFAL